VEISKAVLKKPFVNNREILGRIVEETFC